MSLKLFALAIDSSLEEYVGVNNVLHQITRQLGSNNSRLDKQSKTVLLQLIEANLCTQPLLNLMTKPGK